MDHVRKRLYMAALTFAAIDLGQLGGLCNLGLGLRRFVTDGVKAGTSRIGQRKVRIGRDGLVQGLPHVGPQ